MVVVYLGLRGTKDASVRAITKKTPERRMVPGKSDNDSAITGSKRNDGNFPELSRDMINEQLERRVNLKMVMEFVKSGYIISIYVRKLGDCIEGGNFIQKGISFREISEWIYRTDEFAVEKALENQLDSTL